MAYCLTAYERIVFDLCCLAMFSSYTQGSIQDNYIGCYYDANNQSTLQRRPLPINTLLTTRLCIDQCRLLNATYAGLQNSEACLCGDSFGISLPDTSCNSLCPGDQSEYCGGWNGQKALYSLYAVCEFGKYGYMCDQVCHCRRQAPCDRMTGKCRNGCEEKWSGTSCNDTYLLQRYIGCFRDAEDRAISPDLYGSGNMTVEYCSDRCVSLNNSIAGLQAGGFCSCGESFARYGQIDESNCISTCAANRSQFCGGVWANSVYSVCPAGYYGLKCHHQCNCFNNSRCVYLTGECNSSCKAGWTRKSCNIRDCSTGGGDCSQNETCTTIDLKFAAVTRCRCLPGYGTNSSWGICADVNECELGLCDASTTDCYNAIGSYKCVCKPGYQQNSETSCSDFDECSQSVCDNEISGCYNTIGSYECICKSGYERHNNENTKCYDIDECKRTIGCDNSTTTCKNTVGSFQCSCLEGYEQHSDTSCKRKNPSTSGEIAGAVIGSILGAALIAVIIVFVFCFYRRRRQQQRNSQDSRDSRYRAQPDEKLENPVSNPAYETLKKMETQDDHTYSELTSTEVASQTQNIGDGSETERHNQGRNFAPESGGDQSPPPNF